MKTFPFFLFLFVFYHSIVGRGNAASYPFKSDEYALKQTDIGSSSSQPSRVISNIVSSSSYSLQFWFKMTPYVQNSATKVATILFSNGGYGMSTYFWPSQETGALGQITITLEALDGSPLPSECRSSNPLFLDISGFAPDDWIYYSYSVNSTSATISLFNNLNSFTTSTLLSCLFRPNPTNLSIGTDDMSRIHTNVMYKDVQFWNSWRSFSQIKSQSLIYGPNPSSNQILFWNFDVSSSQCYPTNLGIRDSSAPIYNGTCQAPQNTISVVVDECTISKFIPYSSTYVSYVSPFETIDTDLIDGVVSSSSSNLYVCENNDGLFIPTRSLCVQPSSNFQVNANYGPTSSLSFTIETYLNKSSVIAPIILGYSPMSISTFGGYVSLHGTNFGVKGPLIEGIESAVILFKNLSSSTIDCRVFNDSKMDCYFPPSFDPIRIDSISLCQNSAIISSQINIEYEAPEITQIVGIDFRSFEIRGNNLGGDSLNVSIQIQVVDNQGRVDNQWAVSNSSTQSVLMISRLDNLSKRQSSFDLRDKESYTFTVTFSLGDSSYELKNETVYQVDCGNLQCQFGYCDTINPNSKSSLGYKQCTCFLPTTGGVNCNDTTGCSKLGCTNVNPCRAFGSENKLACSGSANNSNLTGLIVGLVIGGVVLIAIVAIVTFFLLRRYRGRAQKRDFFIPLENKNFDRVMYNVLLDQQIDKKNIGTEDRLQLLEKHLVTCDIASIFELFNAGGQGDADLFVLSLLVILEDNSKTSEALQEILTEEIRKADSSTTLFRSNSLTTKMFTAYSKLIGIEYLYETLGPPLSEILGEEIKLEVDPERMEAGADFDEARWFLMGNTQKCLKSIFQRVEDCPRNISLFLHQVETKVSAMFPGSQRSSVGSFIFLRFFCPAISTPEVYGLADQRPPDQTKRALILITKILQNLSNDVRFGEKEPHMAACNDFIQSNHKKLDEYYAKLLKSASKPQVKREIPKDIKTKAIQFLYTHIQKNIDRIEGSQKQKLEPYFV